MGTICGHLENYCQELTGSLDTDSILDSGLIITVPEIKEVINVSHFKLSPLSLLMLFKYSIKYKWSEVY